MAQIVEKARGRWEGIFNERSFVAQYEDKDLVVKDMATGEALGGGELKSFRALLRYYQADQKKPQREQISRYGTMNVPIYMTDAQRKRLGDYDYD